MGVVVCMLCLILQRVLNLNMLRENEIFIVELTNTNNTGFTAVAQSSVKLKPSVFYG